MAESEWNWINAVRDRVGTHPRVPVGIGDDAALIRCRGDVLVSTDLLMDGVDFIVGETPSELVGRKCLAVNLSDLAAMAAKPAGAVIALSLPKTGGAELARRLYDGLLPLAEEFDCPIVGGDTNSWEGRLVVSVTVMGEPVGRGAVTRSGARPGDWLFVTGPLGGSLPSLRHCTFTPRVREAQILHDAVELHAMMDLSDGLASDLGHLSRASQVGIEIESRLIPVYDDVLPGAPRSERVHKALNDGEDFELVFAVSPAVGQRLVQSPPDGVSLFRIGTCIEAPGVWLIDESSRTPITSGGWSHQFS